MSQHEQLFNDLWDTLFAVQGLYHFTRGSGIAAPQIGALWQVSVVTYENQQYTLINPRIIAHSPSQTPIREGCLSFFDYRGKPLRYDEVTVEALNRTGQPFTLEARGEFASLLQHEIDHLNGKLYESCLAPGEKLTLHSDMPIIP